MKKRESFREFLRSYRRFRIPWWMFILSALMGVVYAEITFRIAEYTIQINKGELFNRVILGYVLLTVGNSLISVLQNQLSNYGSYKITLRARGMTWKKMLHLNVHDVDELGPSWLVSGVTIDVAQASKVISMIFLAVSSIYGFGKACSILWNYSNQMSMYLLTLIPVAVFVFWAVGKMQLFTQKKIYASYNRMTGFFSEHLSASKYVKAQAMEQQELEEGYRAIDLKYRADLVYAVLSTVQTLVHSIYSNISTIITCVFGAKLIKNGKLESTGINSTTTYLGNVNQYMAEILTQYQTIRGTQGTLSQVNGILAKTGEDPEAGAAYRENENKDIVFEHVCFGYEDREVIHDMSFRIPYGKKVAIVGNNGSGKSTLLKLMQGLYLPDQGQIFVAGNEVGKVRLHDLRKHFSYMLQKDHIFSGTIRENICYGCEDEVSEAQIIQAAKLADAHEFIMELPQGYDTVLTEAGMNLSGGQRKRLSFARMFLQQRDYCLLDEAGANLDRRTSNAIYEAVMEKMRDKTVLFIAHEMNEILGADEVLVLDHGSLEAYGTHEELLTSSKIYADYVSRFEKQQGGKKK